MKRSLGASDSRRDAGSGDGSACGFDGLEGGWLEEAFADLLADGSSTPACPSGDVAPGPFSLPGDSDAETDYQRQAAQVIALELGQMTLQERESVYEDIHGVTAVDEETPSFLTAKLDDLEVELGMIRNKPAYEQAKAKNSAYTEDPKLRLVFLRSVRYNPLHAAQRLVRWYEVKLQLFGPRLLTEDITMHDLSPEAQDLLSSGRVQALPVRDSSGRLVVTTLKFDADVFSTNAPAQVFFYFTMTLLEDEATQMTGVVGIHAAIGNFASHTPTQKNNWIRCASTTVAHPVRFQGFHFFAERDRNLLRIANMLQLSFSREIRHRFRIHFGTFQECKYALMGYGIPLGVLPLTDDGEIVMTQHTRWLQRRRLKETLVLQSRSVPVANAPPVLTNALSSLIDNTLSTSDTFSSSSSSSSSCGADNANDTNRTQQTDINDAVVTPTEHDVLLGRGRPFQEHAGNVYLKALIVEWYEKYNVAPRLGKMAVAEQLVHLVHEKNGRFLKKGRDGMWEEVDLSEARSKVSHGFRKKREMDAAQARTTGDATSRCVMKTTTTRPKRIKP